MICNSDSSPPPPSRTLPALPNRVSLPKAPHTPTLHLFCLDGLLSIPHSPHSPCIHPTRDNTINPATTRSYVEVVRGVALRSGRPTTASGPPLITRYILLPRAPTHTPQHPSARGAPTLPRSSTHRTRCAAQHPTWRAAARCYPTTDNTRHNPHPRTPWVAKGTQHAQQRHEGEGRGFVLRLPKEGLSAGTWRRKVVM